MSIEQIEQQIQRLPASEVIRLAEWFNGFLASHAPATAPANDDWQETPELVAKLDRRLEGRESRRVIHSNAPRKLDFPHLLIGDDTSP